MSEMPPLIACENAERILNELGHGAGALAGLRNKGVI